MLDNLETIIQYLDFSDPDKFYFVEVLQRKKDLPDLDRSIRLMQTYTVSSEEKLRAIYPEIKLMCDTFKARAYMYINRRSRKSVGRAMLKTLADYIYSDQYHGLRNLFTSECGKHSAGDKIWILDIDCSYETMDDYKTGILLADKFKELTEQVQPIGDKFIGVVPSKHGYHILVKPFDLRNQGTVISELMKTSPDITEIELKKDAMVNLYIG